MDLSYDRRILLNYSKEIEKRLLTQAEEIECSYIIQNSQPCDPRRISAIQKLVKHNLRYGLSVAKQYQNQGLPLPDLINEASIGLIKAAERFDYSTHKTKFITCAVSWIKQCIKDALCEHARTVRLPRQIHNYKNEFEKLKNKQIAANGVYDIETIAEEMIVPKRIVHDLEKITQFGVSLDEPVMGEDDGQRTRLDTYIPESEKNNDENEDIKRKIKYGLSFLKERDQNIMKDAYGIDREYALSIEDVAIKHDLTEVMIRKIMRDSLDMLKYLINKKK